MNVLTIIPARKGSKTVKRKNIKEIFGKPLIEWTFIEAKKSKHINDIVVSTDDEEVILLARKHDIQYVVRKEEFCGDNSSMIEVVEDTLSRLDKKYDSILILQPTSPFRTSQHIDHSLIKFKEGKFKSLVSVYQAPHQFSLASLLVREGETVRPVFDKLEETYQKQKKIHTCVRNGAIYITKVRYLKTKKSLISNKCAYYLMKEEDSLDLDTEHDFLLAEFIKNKKIIRSK